MAKSKAAPKTKSKPVKDEIEEVEFTEVPKEKIGTTVVVKEIKNIVTDPKAELHKITPKDFDERTIFALYATEDFTADGKLYSGGKYYIAMTTDNKVFVIDKNFFDRFFLLKKTISE